MSGFHGEQTTADGLHIITRWEYASTAARDAASYTAADEGGVARVGLAAPWTFYTLTDATGPTWVQLGAGGGGGGQTDTVVGSNGITNVGTNVNADLAPTYGTTASTVCEGNDARLSDARVPTGAAGGDLGGSYPNPTIAANAVTNAKLAQMPTITFKGNATGLPADPQDLTGTQATAMLDLFTSALRGLVPGSGGGTTNFLRADGAWAAPPGGGGAVWTVVTEGTSSRTAAAGEFVLINNPACVVTLPAPAADARVACKVITGTPTGVEIRTSGAGIEIDGTDYSSTGLPLASQWEQINMISDGTDWFIY